MLTNPIWVIKTRLQLQRSGGLVTKAARPLRASHLGRPFRGSPYRGFLHAVRQIASEEGWRGFYRGLWPSLLLVISIDRTAIIIKDYKVQDICLVSPTCSRQAMQPFTRHKIAQAGPKKGDNHEIIMTLASFIDGQRGSIHQLFEILWR